MLFLSSAVFFFFLFFFFLFFQINFFEKFFQEYHQSVKQFGSRSRSGSKLFAKVISIDETTVVGKEYC